MFVILECPDSWTQYLFGNLVSGKSAYSKSVFFSKCLFVRRHTHMHTHMHTHTHTLTHTHGHTCTHTRTRTHTHYLHALSRNIPIIRPVQGQYRVIWHFCIMLDRVHMRFWSPKGSFLLLPCKYIQYFPIYSPFCFNPSNS